MELAPDAEEQQLHLNCILFMLQMLHIGGNAKQSGSSRTKRSWWHVNPSHASMTMVGCIEEGMALCIGGHSSCNIALAVVCPSAQSMHSIVQSKLRLLGASHNLGLNNCCSQKCKVALGFACPSTSTELVFFSQTNQQHCCRQPNAFLLDLLHCKTPLVSA